MVPLGPLPSQRTCRSPPPSHSHRWRGVIEIIPLPTPGIPAPTGWNSTRRPTSQSCTIEQLPVPCAPAVVCILSLVVVSHSFLHAKGYNGTACPEDLQIATATCSYPSMCVLCVILFFVHVYAPVPNQVAQWAVVVSHPAPNVGSVVSSLLFHCHVLRS